MSFTVLALVRYGLSVQGDLSLGVVLDSQVVGGVGEDRGGATVGCQKKNGKWRRFAAIVGKCRQFAANIFLRL